MTEKSAAVVQQPRPDGRYDCCPYGDLLPCPQAETGHDLPCNASYCPVHTPSSSTPESAS